MLLGVIASTVACSPWAEQEVCPQGHYLVDEWAAQVKKQGPSGGQLQLSLRNCNVQRLEEPGMCFSLV